MSHRWGGGLLATVHLYQNEAELESEPVVLGCFFPPSHRKQPSCCLVTQRTADLKPAGGGGQLPALQKHHLSNVLQVTKSGLNEPVFTPWIPLLHFVLRTLKR